MVVVRTWGTLRTDWENKIILFTLFNAGTISLKCKLLYALDISILLLWFNFNMAHFVCSTSFEYQIIETKT